MIEPFEGYQRRFGGIARVYGQEALERFARAHVLVIGIGGVGSWAVEALARSGIGALTLVDLDHIAESNINRQLHAIEPDLGKAKVAAMAERTALINPACRVTCLETFLEQDNIERLVHDGHDFVVDCIDSFRVKAALIAHCRRHKIRIVTAGGAGGRIDPAQIRLGDLSRTEHDPLLSRTRKLLRQDYNFPRNPKRRFLVPCVYSVEQQRPPLSADSCERRDGSLNCAGFGSVMTVTAAMGLFAVSQVLGKLAEKT
ncbi:MAG: tRNA cyclic N6-threonylcarbamoyladenosine(37) synthase TcdA [Gammaproteobacteria bacterium RIFOXYA12_FULL_61_12]|nr:MAG: tRNA cyclic N6-threonylcarbamoyladenosine(37) synthase TcdA [Gammaproteobacteria bacterium RIFOXYD12_FULL_61_37]OGT94086.1 MAG: tRNA cyclic N6-threonylcarbamoyladenosine(37) synthase TcdA [Gammaproteobacteria bacterium RIFOXYA12_FULL_61_12]